MISNGQNSLLKINNTTNQNSLDFEESPELPRDKRDIKIVNNVIPSHQNKTLWKQI